MPDPCERPPIAGAPLSVLLLAYNEGAPFEEVVTAWIAHLNGLRRAYEILLVEDGSTDKTGAWADVLAGRYPRLRILHHDHRRGLGAALATGLAAAQHPLVFYTTCDRRYDPAELQRLLDQIDQVDLVTGIRVGQPVPAWLRWLDGLQYLAARVVVGMTLQPRLAWLGWTGYPRRWLARWVFGVRLADAECAFRLFRRAALTRVVLQSTGPFAQVEMLAKANFLGCLFAEVPVSHRPLPQGGVTGDDQPWRTGAEAWRVFQHPDFGPAVLPEDRPASPKATPKNTGAAEWFNPDEGLAPVQKKATGDTLPPTTPRQEPLPSAVSEPDRQAPGVNPP